MTGLRLGSGSDRRAASARKRQWRAARAGIRAYRHRDHHWLPCDVPQFHRRGLQDGRRKPHHCRRGLCCSDGHLRHEHADGCDRWRRPTDAGYPDHFTSKRGSILRHGARIRDRNGGGADERRRRGPLGNRCLSRCRIGLRGRSRHFKRDGAVRSPSKEPAPSLRFPR